MRTSDRWTTEEIRSRYPYAYANDFSSDDLDYGSCSLTELALFAEMCAAAGCAIDGPFRPSDTQLARIIEVGSQHGLPAQKCGRFCRRIVDIAKRRNVDLNGWVALWTTMRTEFSLNPQ